MRSDFGTRLNALSLKLIAGSHEGQTGSLGGF